MAARLAWLTCVLCLAFLTPAPARADELIDHGRFEQVRLYRPTGQPRQFVLFLSGDAGWTTAEAALATQLVKRGALVAGIDTPRLQAKLGPDEAPVGDFENLARYLQGYARLKTVYRPVLAAMPAASAFAQRVSASAPADLFAGLLIAQEPELIADYDRLAAGNGPSLPLPPTRLSNLPLVEVPTSGAATPSPAPDVVAIFLSGDGGWAGLDRQVAAALAEQGVSVVGLDSLRYFWRKRTPQGLAGDLDRMVRYYTSHWKRSRVVLIGYSQGANVLPAAFNRLPEATKRSVAQVVLIGLEDKAAWQFHVTGWLGGAPADAEPVAPEAGKLSAATTLCLYGEGDGDSVCDKLPAGAVTAQRLPGGHHFNGDFDGVAARILARLK